MGRPGRPKKNPGTQLNESPERDNPRFSIRTLTAWTGWSAARVTSFFRGAQDAKGVIAVCVQRITEYEEAEGTDIDAEELRLKKAKADVAEIERDARRGLLVSADERNMQERLRVGLMTSRMLALPDVLRLSAGLTIAQTEAVENGIRHALESLADEIEAMDGGIDA